VCAELGQPAASGNPNPVLLTVLVTWNGEPAPGLDRSVFVFDLGSAPDAASIFDFCLPDDDEGCPASGTRFIDHGNGSYSLLANPAPGSGGWAPGSYSVVIDLDDCGLVAGALATVTVP
jgi:hypothetical protein